jgi:antitoxin (DNA-binding transcriptional repressor) of toxin-antitoxin stability system
MNLQCSVRDGEIWFRDDMGGGTRRRGVTRGFGPPFRPPTGASRGHPGTSITLMQIQPLDKVATCSYFLCMRSAKTAGIKELKNKLSAYLREVRLGSVVLVSDHGEIIAELKPPSAETLRGKVETELDELAREGLVTLPSAGKEPLPPSPIILARGASQALLDADRGK